MVKSKTSFASKFSPAIRQAKPALSSCFIIRSTKPAHEITQGK
ncbi:hypothetical protein C943_02688 [Mariniradius saccharolyticus AK6]|uniref:Uncharacterized protein n=1 Tax=Mariniradius saccharolyticus AK6 TaxID=1239962 RepID=M7X7Z0_9BACT|nr:hypothetical protein C943_02688 [Mariniradius saccharolyticus AK6]